MGTWALRHAIKMQAHSHHFTRQDLKIEAAIKLLTSYRL